MAGLILAATVLAAVALAAGVGGRSRAPAPAIAGVSASPPAPRPGPTLSAAKAPPASPAGPVPPAVSLPSSNRPLDADTLVYSSLRAGNGDIYAARVTSGGVAAEWRLTSGPDRDLHPVIMPGRRTVIYFDGSHPSLRVVAADGAGDRPLFRAGPAAALRIAGDSRPTVSPDGRFIAVTVAAGPQGTGLYVIGIDGAYVHRLPAPARSFDPAWSPHGDRIAYWTGPGATGGALWVAPASGGGRPARLTAGSAGADPTWSPDGGTIAYTHGLGGSRNASVIALMGPDGADQRPLTSGPGFDTDPAISPDGRHVAFAGRPTQVGDYDLFVVGVDGSGQRRLTDRSGFDGVPRWSAG